MSLSTAQVSMKIVYGAIPVMLLSSGCACDREACSMWERPASAGAQATIAGVVVLESDQEKDGCRACTTSSADVTIWKTDQAVTDSESARMVMEGDTPTQQTRASERYRLSVEPGTYLLCVERGCVSVEVKALETTTVNIKTRFGPPSFVVFSSDQMVRAELLDTT